MDSKEYKGPAGDNKQKKFENASSKVPLSSLPSPSLTIVRPTAGPPPSRTTGTEDTIAKKGTTNAAKASEGNTAKATKSKNPMHLQAPPKAGIPKAFDKKAFDKRCFLAKFPPPPPPPPAFPWRSPGVRVDQEVCRSRSRSPGVPVDSHRQARAVTARARITLQADTKAIPKALLKINYKRKMGQDNPTGSTLGETAIHSKTTFVDGVAKVSIDRVTHRVQRFDRCQLKACEGKSTHATSSCLEGNYDSDVAEKFSYSEVDACYKFFARKLTTTRVGENYDSEGEPPQEAFAPTPKSKMFEQKQKPSLPPQKSKAFLWSASKMFEAANAFYERKNEAARRQGHHDPHALYPRV